MPSSAPRPMPTMTAVGVASPRAQGQAMTRTEISVVRAKRNVWPTMKIPAEESDDGDGQDDRDEDRDHAVGEALHRGLGALAPPGPAG